MLDFETAVRLTQELIRIDTTNPPGNEEKAVLFMEDILKREGIPSEIFSPAPGRANILARIRGKQKGNPAMLLCHLDVVPANPDEWEVDPFGGVIREGFLYGRGAIDMKTQAICQLMAFIELHRQGVVPERDLIFLGTCDEEVGGQNGVEFMLKEVPDLRDASFVLSEGGHIMVEEGRAHAQVSVAEKKLAQFMVRATGTGGHGSTPHKDSATEKVIRAAGAILSCPWPLKATAVASAYLNGVLRGTRGKGFVFKNLRDALRNRNFRNFIEENPVYNALLRNTVTLTILKGGEKVNVIPTESTASFDARLLPSESHERFFKKIRRLAGKDVEISRIGGGMSEPAPSGFNTPYFGGIRRIVAGMNDAIPALPFVTTGATDLRYFRNLGVIAYGFFPVTLSKEELLNMHGKNERISLENVREGLEGTYEIVKLLASINPPLR
jgi:acetylornithine deacetylase/succinyl-diaminopimelate desuccinylase-like protein